MAWRESGWRRRTWSRRSSMAHMFPKIWWWHESLCPFDELFSLKSPTPQWVFTGKRNFDIKKPANTVSGSLLQIDLCLPVRLPLSFQNLHREQINIWLWKHLPSSHYVWLFHDFHFSNSISHLLHDISPSIFPVVSFWKGREINQLRFFPSLLAPVWIA